ncbi:hypothetical protein ACI2OX_19950 [Bacillus sp. N9]
MNMWTVLFKSKRDREAEFKKLQALEAENESCKMAAIHIAILLEEDDWAIEKIIQLSPDAAPYALSWLKLLQADRQTKRLARFFPVFLTMITTYISALTRNYEQAQFTRVLFHVLDSEMALKLDSNLLEKAYINLLPHSRYQYIAYLLDKQDYRKWAELQLYTENTLEYIDSHTISIVAKHDPSALRPLYHETITALINNRNRDSYKRAVRYLKRLQKLYKRKKCFPIGSDIFPSFVKERNVCGPFRKNAGKEN